MSASSSTGLVARLIAACARSPGLTLVLCLFASAWGVWGLQNVGLDAVPDLSDPQVIVQTDWAGRSPDLVEDHVTFPLSAELLATPMVDRVRGQSMFGTSSVTVIFEDGTDLYDARSRVLETLSRARAGLPDGVSPRLGPDATAVGWVYQYALVDRTGEHDLAELRALQDWDLRYALLSVDGVAEVASVGGFVEQWQVEVDPDRLLAHGISVPQVARALRESSVDAGGGTIELAGHEQIIRGRGQIEDLAELERVPVARTPDGTPVLVGDVAWVTRGPAPRRGIAELDGEGEVVGAIVLARPGTNTVDVIERVEARLDELRPGLPDGVEIVVTYDRSDLIGRAIDTLRHTLLEEMLVVAVVIGLFLFHWRSALVPVIALPLAVLLSFGPMASLGFSANIMSLGGIAVAIGAMVDASVVLVENVHKRLGTWHEEGEPGSRRDVIIGAMQEVGPGIFSSLLVITVSFLPVFGLQAAEGRLFRPLATTKTFSMAFAALFAVTLVPALVVLVVRGKVRAHSRMESVLIGLYEPIVRRVVRWRWAVVLAAMALVGATVPAVLSLEGEFMPPLDEGDLLFMPTAPPGMGATEAARALQAMDAAIIEVPEVERVFGKMGRADTATDPAPLNMAETTILLKPRDQWREGLTREALLDELDAAVQIPGMPNLWWMPIQTRTEMLNTGLRSPVGVALKGATIEELEAAALELETVLQAIPGTKSAVADRATGAFYLDIEVDRVKAGRHGLSVAEVYQVVEAAIGGIPVGRTIQARQPIPLTLRYPRELRQDPDALARVLLPTDDGGQIPLGQVAELSFTTGPPVIRSEDGRLVTYVFVDPGKVPVTRWVEQARERVAELALPGVHVAYVGQFQALQRSFERLLVLLPLTLALVALLLWAGTRSVVETAMILLAVPFSLVGAVWLLWFLEFDLSVAVGVGLIALAGLDAETAVVMLLYLRLSWRRRSEEGLMRDRRDLEEAIVEGAAQRLRPKLMTVFTTMLGLLPIFWSTGAGHEVMQRIAAPMVGGLVTSFLLELTVYPALFAIWRGWRLPLTATSPDAG